MDVPVKGGRPSAGFLPYNEISVEHPASSWTAGVWEGRAEKTIWTEEGSDKRVEKSALCILH